MAFVPPKCRDSVCDAQTGSAAYPKSNATCSFRQPLVSVRELVWGKRVVLLHLKPAELPSVWTGEVPSLNELGWNFAWVCGVYKCRAEQGFWLGLVRAGWVEFWRGIATEKLL